MDVNSIYQVSHLEAWQGSTGTGPGYMSLPRKKKQDEEKSKKEKPAKGITHDDSGIVHVDLIA